MTAIDQFNPSHSESLHCSRRRAQVKHAASWHIEGRYVTTAEIAEITGYTARSVRERLQRLRDKPGAVTWEKLGFVTVDSD